MSRSKAKSIIFIFFTLVFLLSCNKQTTQVGTSKIYELKFSGFQDAAGIYVLVNSKQDKTYSNSNSVFYLNKGDKLTIKYRPSDIRNDITVKGNFLKILLNDVIIQQYDCYFKEADSCKTDFSITI